MGQTSPNPELFEPLAAGILQVAYQIWQSAPASTQNCEGDGLEMDLFEKCGPKRRISRNRGHPALSLRMGPVVRDRRGLTETTCRQLLL
jgi:hypothetical protein